MSDIKHEHVKVVDIKAHDNEDIVARLEKLLGYAKENRLSNFAAVYWFDDEPAYCLSYRSKARIQVIGLLDALKTHLLSYFEME